MNAVDSYKSKSMVERFAGIVDVPQSRFCTAVDLLDGITKLELEKRNGNTAYGKDGIKVFQNLNKGGEDVRKKAAVVTAFKSEV